MEHGFTRIGRIESRSQVNGIGRIKKNKREWSADLRTEFSGADLKRIKSARDWNGLKKAEHLFSMEGDQRELVENVF